MKNLSLLVLLLFCLNATSQNLVVNNTGVNSDPVNLATNVLSGGGLVVYNVTSSGLNAQQIGYYSSGTAAIGSASGIAISTGNVLDAGLSNTSAALGTNLGASGATDADIIQLTGASPASDWYILEFDFIPQGNQISMQYVFASEEYQDYVCSNQADGFAVLISGPGFSGAFSGGADLISLVPSTTNPVGINSINNGVTGTFGTPGGCLGTGASPYYNANTDSLMEFNGYTDLLTLNASVECEQVYHMRILLFDRGSKNYDSGIFLAERSFTSNGTGVYDNPIYQDSVVVEGCAPYNFSIYNVAGFSNDVINLSITGTATNGVDYNTIANPMVLPVGEDYFLLQINPINDGIAEGTEDVTVAFDMINLCGDTIHHEFTIYIQDQNPITVGSFPANQSICQGEIVLLNADLISGGIAPYNITWNGLPINNTNISPSTTTTYYCDIYDQAGCPYYNNFTLTVYPVPIVDAGPDLSVCKNDQQVLGITIDGGTDATYQWSPSSQLNNATLAYPTMTVIANQTYVVTVNNPGGCSQSDTVVVTMLPRPSVNAGPDQSVVYLQTSETLVGTGGGAPSWYPDLGLSCSACLTPSASPMQTTTYTLTITGANGCQSTDDVLVTVEVPTDVFVPTAFSPNGDGNNDNLFLRCYTVEKMMFRVYDMWGNLMFETNDPSKGWDGKANGQEASIGMYMWTASVVFVNNAGTKELAGQVNLVR